MILIITLDYTETYNMDMVWISKSFVLFEFNLKREHERFYRLSCITNQKKKSFTYWIRCCTSSTNSCYWLENRVVFVKKKFFLEVKLFKHSKLGLHTLQMCAWFFRQQAFPCPCMIHAHVAFDLLPRQTPPFS